MIQGLLYRRSAKLLEVILPGRLAALVRHKAPELEVRPDND
jgi:hypothetical protein